MLEEKLVEEQVIETTTPETTTEETEEIVTPTEEQTEEVTEPQVEIDIDKLVQSAASKAKGEILKALGIKSVDEGKEALSYRTKFEELEIKHNELVAEHTARENELLVGKLGIAKEHADLFLKMVETETAGATREENAMIVRDKIIAMVGGTVKVGTGKTKDDAPTLQDELRAMKNL